MAFVDLEKAFDRVPRKVIRWMLRKLGVEEWIVRLVQGMYANARSRVRVGEGYSEDFEVKVGAHQGSVLSPLLFIIVLEALSREFRSGVPWEDLYALWPCYHRWITWGMCQGAPDSERSNGEERTESKCRKDEDHDLRYGTGPPAEFRRVSMRCLSHWSGHQQHLLQWLQALGAQEMQWAQALEKGPWLQMYTVPGNCTPLEWQTTDARLLNGRPQKKVQVGPDKLEVVASFCYLGIMLSAAGGCERSTTTRVNTAWKKFKDLLPVLSSRHLSFKTRGRVYSSCVRSAMLHASETWQLTKPNLQRLQRNDRAMIRQICNVRPQNIVTTGSNELLVRLGIEDLDLILKEKRLRWSVECSNGAVKTAFDIQVDGKREPKWHGSSWQRGIAESGSSRLSTLMIAVPGDLVWDLPCVQQASYLVGGPLMWMLPLYLHVNQKSDYDDMIWWRITCTLKYNCVIQFRVCITAQYH